MMSPPTSAQAAPSEPEIVRQFRKGNLAFLERLPTTVPVARWLPSHELEHRMYELLQAGRVDDFCFLFQLYSAGAPRPLDARRIAACFPRLARSGAVAGLETVAKLTHVAPVLDAATARLANDALVAAGRLAAVDYVSQLSHLAPTFSPRAVQIGYRSLLLAGRYEAMNELWTLSGLSPELDAEEIAMAFASATAGQHYGAIALLGRWFDPPRVPWAEVPALVARLVESGDVDEIPHLMTLATPAYDLADLPDAALAAMTATGAMSTLGQLFAHAALAGRLTAHAETACRRAVERCDRALVLSICERCGLLPRLSALDLEVLDADAREAGDHTWFAFAARLRAAEASP